MLQVRLDPNAWHRRLQMWTFNDPDMVKMPNLCPYFWLTVFCLAASPFVGFVRAAEAPVLWLFELLGSGVQYTATSVQSTTKTVKDMRYYSSIAHTTERVTKGVLITLLVVIVLGLLGALGHLMFTHVSETLVVLGITLALALASGLIWAFAEYRMSIPGYAKLMTGVEHALGSFLDLLAKVFSPVVYVANACYEAAGWMATRAIKPFPLVWGYLLGVKERLCPAIEWVEVQP